MRILYESNQYDLADNLLVSLAFCDYWLEQNTKMLDFGCGEGGLVYRLRNLGYDAYGFDIHDRVQYRTEADRAFFGFSSAAMSDTAITTFDASTFALPFPNDTFDIIVSASVIEHVINLDLVMKEIARVLKPTGISFHLYPKKSVFIEPHIYVPLGSRFQSWWYLYVWALLGVRNEFQETLSAKDTADINFRYTRTGLRYYSKQELVDIVGTYFSIVRFVGKQFHYKTNLRMLIPWKIRALFSKSPLRNLARSMQFDVLLTASKR